ncbi:hypothetical protein D3C86_2095430 [compost metagenome]
MLEVVGFAFDRQHGTEPFQEFGIIIGPQQVRLGFPPGAVGRVTDCGLVDATDK